MLVGYDCWIYLWHMPELLEIQGYTLTLSIWTVLLDPMSVIMCMEVEKMAYGKLESYGVSAWN